MTDFRRWFRGWAYQFSAAWQQWRKSHGQRQPLSIAWKLGACGRYVIDGQYRGKREPTTGIRSQTMTEHLRPCPFCGEITIEKAANPEVEWGRCDSCGAEGPTTIHWNARSLGPALAVVLEFVENKDNILWHIVRQIRHQETLQNPLMDANAFERHRFLAMLRALRDAHSLTDIPSNSEEDK